MKAKTANRSAVGHFSILATSSDDDENSVEWEEESRDRQSEDSRSLEKRSSGESLKDGFAMERARSRLKTEKVKVIK